MYSWKYAQEGYKIILYVGSCNHQIIIQCSFIQGLCSVTSWSNCRDCGILIHMQKARLHDSLRVIYDKRETLWNNFHFQMISWSGLVETLWCLKLHLQRWFILDVPNSLKGWKAYDYKKWPLHMYWCTRKGKYAQKLGCEVLVYPSWRGLCPWNRWRGRFCKTHYNPGE